MKALYSSDLYASDLYLREQVRCIDEQAIGYGASAYALMQRASSALLRTLIQRWPQAKQVLIMCGAGNNAGDGYELARQAQETGLQIQVLYLKSPHDLTGAASTAAASALAAGVDCQSFSPAALTLTLQQMSSDQTVIVDGLLGIGFTGQLSPLYALAIACMNDSAAPVLAIDVPSGVNADTGYVDTIAVNAAATLCVVARKQGLYTGDAPAFTGALLFDDLGIADIVYTKAPSTTPSARAIDARLLQLPCLARSRTAHKGDSGHVLVIGGDLGFGGAAMMAAEAAARSGAGTVSLITRAAHVSAMLVRRPEIMVHGFDEHGAAAERARELMARATAIVLGPGLGRSAWSAALLQDVLSQAVSSGTPLVLDADALNMLAAQNTCWQELGSEALRAQWIITPHPGEAARLLGCSAQQVSQDRFAAVKTLQQKTGAVCILKGAGSLLAFPDAQAPVDICVEGNPGMASGGMGDVLAGICGAMLALGRAFIQNSMDKKGACKKGVTKNDALVFDASLAARLAVCAHGEAADQAAAALGERGLLATDLLERLPALLSGPDWRQER